MRMNYQIEEDVLVENEVVTEPQHDLIVYNDDVNTFEHVIDTFVDILSHEPHQAEQCALIIHFKGKCGVKKGTFGDLVPMRIALCDRGLSAEIC